MIRITLKTVEKFQKMFWFSTIPTFVIVQWFIPSHFLCKQQQRRCFDGGLVSRFSGGDTGSEQLPAEVTGPSTTPQRILHLHPSVQFVTIPDSPGYQVVPTLKLSPLSQLVIGLPLPSPAATPTFYVRYLHTSIHVPDTIPTPSPPCRRQVPPLSPGQWVRLAFNSSSAKTTCHGGKGRFGEKIRVFTARKVS